MADREYIRSLSQVDLFNQQLVKKNNDEIAALLNSLATAFSEKTFVGADAGDQSKNIGSGTLAAIVSTIGDDDGYVFFKGGNTYTITSDDITVPSNITLSFAPGAVISIASGKTLTVNGQISAGCNQIFTGDGDVVFGRENQVIISEWFSTLQLAVDSIGTGNTLIGGDYTITTKIDMTSLPENVDIDLGIITANADITAIEISADKLHFRCKEILRSGTTTKPAVILRSCWRSKIHVREIDEFYHGVKLVGEYGYKSRNGCIYNTITVDHLVATNYCYYIEADSESNGYVNENRFVGGWLSGAYGFFCNGDTGEDYPHDRNIIDCVGFESISTACIYLKYAKYWVSLFPRYEGGPGDLTYQIYEDANCVSNKHYANYLYDSLLSLSGVYCEIYSEGRKDDGGRLWFRALQNADGDFTYYGNEYDAALKNNTLLHEGTGGVYDDGFLYHLKDSSGTLQNAARVSPYGYQLINNTQGDTNVDDYATLLRVASNGTSELILVMPAKNEISGYCIDLWVYYFSEAISVKKSTNVEVIADGVIDSTGLWRLVYNGSWYAFKISSDTP